MTKRAGSERILTSLKRAAIFAVTILSSLKRAGIFGVMSLMLLLSSTV
jgi:hypothetical protein